VLIRPFIVIVLFFRRLLDEKDCGKADWAGIGITNFYTRSTSTVWAGQQHTHRVGQVGRVARWARATALQSGFVT